MSFTARLSVTSILISSLLVPPPAADAAAFCAKRFESLYGESLPALAQYRKSGLRGLDRAGILAVDAHLQAARLAQYEDKSLLRGDVRTLFEIQCLKTKSNCGELLKWWTKNSSQYLDSPQFLEVLANPKLTVRDFSELASSQFYLQVGRTKGNAWKETFSFLFSPRALVAAVGAVGVSVGLKVLATLYNAATLGTMMKLWNAYTDAAVAPVEAHLKQQGTKDLAGVATHIQEWLIHRAAVQQQLADLKTKVDATERKVNEGALSAEDAKKLWEDFQSYFYGKFMAFNQSLPGNMREGRAFIYSTEFSEPMAIANFISGRHESYREGLRLVRSLEQKEQSGTATDLDRIDLEDQKRYLEIQKKQIAAGLAVFIIRKYMYRDDIYRSVFDANKQLVVKLDDIQHELIEAFGIQYFMSEFFTQVKDVFRQYDLIFQAADIQSHLLLQSTKPQQ
jgi:hypothetical protein